jgi:predicted 3-demethylubiquinone-9 3-methyltransferase (glyoxalase superfamily)
MACLVITAINGGPQFKFNEAVSFLVECKDQVEVDSYWNALLAGGGEPSVCGWLKDRFGLSWQVSWTPLIDMLLDADKEKAGRAMQAMLKMSRLDVAALQKAYEAE